jgi:hypothetical protein
MPEQGPSTQDDDDVLEEPYPLPEPFDPPLTAAEWEPFAKAVGLPPACLAEPVDKPRTREVTDV